MPKKTRLKTWTREELESEVKRMEKEGYVIIRNRFKCSDCGGVFVSTHPIDMAIENIECALCRKRSANIIFPVK